MTWRGANDISHMAENDASFGSKLTTDTPDFDSVINNLPMNILRLESGFSRDPEEPAPCFTPA